MKIEDHPDFILGYALLSTVSSCIGQGSSVVQSSAPLVAEAFQTIFARIETSSEDLRKHLIDRMLLGGDPQQFNIVFARSGVGISETRSLVEGTFKIDDELISKSAAIWNRGQGTRMDKVLPILFDRLGTTAEKFEVSGDWKPGRHGSVATKTTLTFTPACLEPDVSKRITLKYERFLSHLSIEEPIVTLEATGRASSFLTDNHSHGSIEYSNILGYRIGLNRSDVGLNPQLAHVLIKRLQEHLNISDSELDSITHEEVWSEVEETCNTLLDEVGYSGTTMDIHYGREIFTRGNEPFTINTCLDTIINVWVNDRIVDGRIHDSNHGKTILHGFRFDQLKFGFTEWDHLPRSYQRVIVDHFISQCKNTINTYIAANKPEIV